MKTQSFKTLAIATALMATSSVANAVEIDFFAGAGVGYQMDTVEGTVNKDTEGEAWQGRIGMLIEQQHRITGTFSYMEDKFNQGGSQYKQEQYSWLASYDYLIPVHKDVNLFVGVTAGANDNKIGGKSSADFVWGGQAGVQYKWTEHFSSDLGYRYLAQDYDKNGIEISDSQQIYLTFDYKF
ncbi:porin family protein [Shewanella sp. WXL01]|uniref:outer membrane beta-barrel protein n=1 Tax=Shewanella sp. WXL01 TaxID=2709721 RepID=UPI0014382C90|nr:outer membrane beta-barrel protein [Shewanella sp. WXL01]NKF49378.1 porin family protein [Shewanella sp. WXL01]